MKKSIHAPNVSKHKNPIPHASLLKGLIISSAINGFDKSNGQFPIQKEKQMEVAFENMLRILNEGNASYDNIIKIDLYFNDKSDRKFVNPIWLKIFPDENKRPARHSHLAVLDHPCVLQIVFTAVI